MNPMLRALRGIAGLFFDDGTLAICVLFILVVTEILSKAEWFDPSWAAAFLVAGIVAALIENFLRTAFTLRSRG